MLEFEKNKGQVGDSRGTRHDRSQAPRQRREENRKVDEVRDQDKNSDDPMVWAWTKATGGQKVKVLKSKTHVVNGKRLVVA